MVLLFAHETNKKIKHNSAMKESSYIFFFHFNLEQYCFKPLKGSKEKEKGKEKDWERRKTEQENRK